MGGKKPSKGRFRHHHHSKGKKWKKGHSSSSNPKNKTHRNAAKRGFFHNSRGNSNLTPETLARHNAAQMEQDGLKMTVTASDSQSIGSRTHGTFLSSLTNCTNPTFNKVHYYNTINSELQKETLAILAAVTEVIKSKGGKETETEYFAALMTTLETIEGDLSISACTYLLSLCMKRVPRAVLQSKFSEVSKILLIKLDQHAESDCSILFKRLISCLTTLLRAQEIAVWRDSSTQQIFLAVLSFCTHVKPKIRKEAHGAVCAILKGSNIMLQDKAPASHPAAPAAAKFCIHQIEECGGLGKATTTLHMLSLLKYLLAVFPTKYLKRACEAILKIMTLGNVLILSTSMQALHGMFVSRPKQINLPKEMNAQLITALYDYQPGDQDIQSILSWLTVMKEGHLNLMRLDEQLCLDHLPRLFQTLMRFMTSQHNSVVQTAADSLKTILEECIPPWADAIAATLKSPSGLTPLEKMFESVEGGLSYQYHAAWGPVLQVLSTFFKVIGKQCHHIMKKCLLSLADLRESVHFQNKYDADAAFGAAIRSMGPEIVLSAVPLHLDVNSSDMDFSRSWLLPLLKDNIQNTRLGFFIEYFLPLAAQFRIAADQASAAEEDVKAKIFNILQSQIWSFLKGFCTHPTDLCQSFKGIAKILGTAMIQRNDLRMNILSVLRHLIMQNLDHDENRTELAKYSKNYLPILFNLYTSESEDQNSSGKVANDPWQLPVFETIKIYLKITDKKLICEFFDQILSKLQEFTDSGFKKHTLMDIGLTMASYLNEERVEKLYDISKSELKNSDRTTQKKSYRILEEICSGNSAECQAFVIRKLPEIKKLLLDALSVAVPSSKSPRLRCLTKILQYLTSGEDFLEAIIPEVILCIKEAAERARQAAFTVLVEIGNALLRWNKKSEADIMRDYFKLILAGLGGSPLMMSATILALTRAVYEFRDQLPSDLLELVIYNISQLLKSKIREVIQASLAFLKVLVVMIPEHELAQHVELIISSLVNLSDGHRRALRFKSKSIFERLIRKFGYAMIRSLVPESEHKLLLNIKKTELRAKRKKADRKKNYKDDDDDDIRSFKSKKTVESFDDLLVSNSESEDDDDDMKSKKTIRSQRLPPTWLTESGEDDIMDFMDPLKVAKKVSATKPDLKPKENRFEFKTAPDGRMIIMEDSDEDETATKSTKVIDAEDLSAIFKGPTKKSMKRKNDDNDIEDVDVPAKYKPGGSGIHRPTKIDKKKSNVPVGQAYKAKKAGGDRKLKGKPDPFAYVPLSVQKLNKRKRAKMAGQFKGIVQGAKKGAQKGSKNWKKNKSKRR